MSFHLTQQHIDQFEADGYAIFRQVLSPGLLSDLRRACEDGRDQVRDQHGGQVQRFQPVSGLEIDQRPFQAFRELPELNDAITRILSPRHSYGDLDTMGCLLEPRDLPHCTPWHRDWRDNTAMDKDVWLAERDNLDFFNQINCALYEDSCTWVVPGSHNRDDTPEEAATFPVDAIPFPDLKGKSAAERERLCYDYCRSMPGAMQVMLHAGDLLLYRNSLWHIGNYLPYKRRSTLHDSAMTPAYQAWWSAYLQQLKKAAS